MSDDDGGDRHRHDHHHNNLNPDTLLALTADPDDVETRRAAGYLEVRVLSAYDLPARAPPRGVRVTVPGREPVTSGPPVQRHKDRNSFKFVTSAGSGRTGGNTNNNTSHDNDGASSSANANEVEIVAPLASLYPSTVTFSVVYEHDTGLVPLRAEYDLDQLKIHETQWLVLNLETATEDGAGGGGTVTTTTSNGNDNGGVQEDDTTFRVPSTLRLNLTLHGPYRTEVQAALQVATTWFGIVDRLESSGAVVVRNLPDPQWFLLPAVPLVALAVVSTPVVAGVAVVALPMVLPVLVVMALATTALAVTAVAVYASTRQGRREWLQPLVVRPVVEPLLSTPTGQRCIYQTGARPTPVHLCRVILPRESLWGKLIIGLWIDLMGSASYLLPVVGEGFDLVWAPLQTVFIMAMYDDITPHLKYVSFAEEILPFTDVVPSATIGWLAEFGVPWVKERLGLKDDSMDPSRASPGSELLTTTTPSTPFSTPR